MTKLLAKSFSNTLSKLESNYIIKIVILLELMEEIGFESTAIIVPVSWNSKFPHESWFYSSAASCSQMI